MLAGTFSLVMAQRLLRKLDPSKKQHISVKDTQFYKRANKNLEAIDPIILKEEIAIRGISQEQRYAFVNDGMAYVATDDT